MVLILVFNLGVGFDTSELALEETSNVKGRDHSFRTHTDAQGIVPSLFMYIYSTSVLKF